MAKARIVQIAENHRLMHSDGLWLTTGGRVVKPGFGEYASIKTRDLVLMDPGELEQGMKMDEFHRRYMAARRKWKRRERKLRKAR